MIRNGISNIIPWKDMGIDEVLMASSGEEALSVIEKEMPQIMLTDICMVEMTGLTLIEKVRKINQDMKIIVLTGYDDFKYAQTCCKLNVQDFILKPADEEELTNSIKKQVEELDAQSSKLRRQQLMNRVKGFAEQVELENSMRSFLAEKVPLDTVKQFCERFSFNPEQVIQIAIILPAMIDEESWDGYHDYMHLSVKNICIDTFDSNNEGITFEDKNARILIALFSNDEFDETVDRMNRLKELLKNEIDVQENIALGNAVRGFEHINVSYTNALQLLDSVQEKQDDILQSEGTELRLQTVYQKYSEHKKVMLENIGDIDKLTDEFDRFEKCIGKYSLSNPLAKRLCFELACALYYKYISDTGSSTNDALNSLLNSLLIADRSSIYKFTKSFIQQLFGQEENNTHEMISTAKRYIKDNLSKELTVTSIAETLYLLFLAAV